MGRMIRKTQRRVESLLAWVLALVFILLLAAGAYYVWTEVIVL